MYIRWAVAGCSMGIVSLCRCSAMRDALNYFSSRPRLKSRKRSSSFFFNEYVSRWVLKRETFDCNIQTRRGDVHRDHESLTPPARPQRVTVTGQIDVHYIVQLCAKLTVTLSLTYNLAVRYPPTGPCSSCRGSRRHGRLDGSCSSLTLRVPLPVAGRYARGPTWTQAHFMTTCCQCPECTEPPVVGR
jgi:hypothetical protein